MQTACHPENTKLIREIRELHPSVCKPSAVTSTSSCSGIIGTLDPLKKNDS